MEGYRFCLVFARGPWSLVTWSPAGNGHAAPRSLPGIKRLSLPQLIITGRIISTLQLEFLKLDEWKFIKLKVTQRMLDDAIDPSLRAWCASARES